MAAETSQSKLAGHPTFREIAAAGVDEPPLACWTSWCCRAAVSGIGAPFAILCCSLACHFKDVRAMTDSAAQLTARSTFPPPPPWWRLYPPDPFPQFSTNTSASDAPPRTPLPTAFGLPIFEPPLPPATPTTPYTLFNQIYTTHPPPPQLPPHTPQLPLLAPTPPNTTTVGRTNYAQQLSQLITTLLTHWLALLNALTTATPATATLTALSHCYTHITHVLAGLRRHQAVQHVLLLVSGQLQKRRERRERLEAEVGRCRELLAGYGMVWEEGDRSVGVRRREGLEGVKGELKEVKAVVKEEMEVEAVRVKEEAQNNREEEVGAEDGDDEWTAEDEAEERHRQSQLAALLDSLVDTGE